MLDMGFQGKVRPIMIMSREDPNAPRALALFVPLTMETRGGKYEVAMPRVPWLRLNGYANTQGIGSVGYHELKDKRGRFDTATVEKVKDAIRWAFDL